MANLVVMWEIMREPVSIPRREIMVSWEESFCFWVSFLLFIREKQKM